MTSRSSLDQKIFRHTQPHSCSFIGRDKQNLARFPVLHLSFAKLPPFGFVQALLLQVSQCVVHIMWPICATNQQFVPSMAQRKGLTS